MGLDCIVRLLILLLFHAGAVLSESSDVRLESLVAADWEYQKQHSPALAQFSDDAQFPSAWADLSPSGLQDLRSHDNSTLSELRAINRSQLSSGGRLTARLFERDLRMRLEEFRLKAYLTHFWEFARFGPSPLRLLGFLRSAPQAVSPEQLRARAMLLDAFPEWVENQIRLMRQARAEGILPPLEVVRSAIADINAELKALPGTSVFERTFKAPAPPALRRLRDFLMEAHLPVCPVPVSLARQRNGRKLYAELVRRSTTTVMSPREIHRLGLAEVARVRKHLLSTARTLGHRGSLDEFFLKVRSDPKLYFTSADEMLSAFRDTGSRIGSPAQRLFLPFTPAPLDIQTRSFPHGPMATYRPGLLIVNVADLATRPKYEVTALMLHEGIPGHHLQKTYAPPNVTPDGRFRKSDAFTEGWGLYAESLGDDMEFYTDAYNRLGRLTLELLRAVRLVIDTGIHHAGWTRDQAQKYFTENTGKPAALAGEEISRAVRDPGALLAYKVGELAIQSMRREAQHHLGSKFNIRSFHDFILRTGPLPLDVLKETFSEWLQTQR